MVKRRKTARPRKLKRDPVARALSAPLYRQKVVEGPDRPPRRPKHPKRLDEEDSGN